MILIVDDDAGTASSFERMLRYSGLPAVACGSATEALSLLHVRRPKLIVADIHMPCMNGITLIQAIRADPRFNGVPILVYSSDFSQDCERLARQAGAQDFVVKGTVGWESLIGRVKRLIDEDRPGSMRLTS